MMVNLYINPKIYDLYGLDPDSQPDAITDLLANSMTSATRYWGSCTNTMDRHNSPYGEDNENDRQGTEEEQDFAFPLTLSPLPRPGMMNVATC